MRGLFFPAIILCTVILAALGYFVFHPEADWRQATAVLTGSSVAKAPHAEPSRGEPTEKASGKPKPTTDKSRSATTDQQSTPFEGSVTARVIPMPPTEMRRRFPLAPEVTSGTAKSTVLATFGPADVTVTGADRTQLLERLLYRDTSSRRATLIFLVDGSVTRAETYLQ